MIQELKNLVLGIVLLCSVVALMYCAVTIVTYIGAETIKLIGALLLFLFGAWSVGKFSKVLYKDTQKLIVEWRKNKSQ